MENKKQVFEDESCEHEVDPENVRACDPSLLIPHSQKIVYKPVLPGKDGKEERLLPADSEDQANSKQVAADPAQTATDSPAGESASAVSDNNSKMEDAGGGPGSARPLGRAQVGKLSPFSLGSPGNTGCLVSQRWPSACMPGGKSGMPLLQVMFVLPAASQVAILMACLMTRPRLF